MDHRWTILARLAADYATPAFLVWTAPFYERLKRLNSVLAPNRGAPIRHWYSYKTLPIPRMATVANQAGLGIEVVSAFEFDAVLNLGIPPRDILVNGVAKHTWLPKNIPNLNVIFDSYEEARELVSVARDMTWRVGIRVAVSNQVDPDDVRYPAQFGVVVEQVAAVANLLQFGRCKLDILHFHIRTNVSSIGDYLVAIRELASLPDAITNAVSVIDVGGGLPDDDTVSRETNVSRVRIHEYGDVIADCHRSFPKVTEVWLENGRFLVGPSAVLLLSVLECKTIRDYRFVICDGGRTNHALESDWECHDIGIVSQKFIRTESVPTVVCGPNCMAYDWIYRGELPSGIMPGDRLIYYNAGAYHIPWETRFSRGSCGVLFSSDSASFEEIRVPETSGEWFSRWK